MLALVASMFDDPQVTDVAFNRFDRALARSRQSWRPVSSPFLSEDEFREWLIGIVESTNARLDFQNPATSVVTAGYRVHAVLGAGVCAEAKATIRKLNSTTIEIFQSDPASRFRMQAILDASRRRENVLIAGAAGAGKTTVLRNLLKHFQDERIITIEDVPELQLDSPNTVSLTSRMANTESSGEINLQRLLFEALRMSPDRIAVGEVRGAELITMLDALNTGHAGAGATIHANSLEGVAARVTAIGLACGLRQRATAMQAITAFSIVAFLSNRGDYRIDGLGKFQMNNSGSLEVVPIA